MAGLSTDARVLAQVDRFLDSVQADGGSQYAYTDLADPSLTMTAEALLCREYLGWDRNDPRLIRGCGYLMQELISVAPANDPTTTGTTQTQTLHHFGGEEWQEWNQAMRVELPRMQLQEGRDRGSWPPQSDVHSSSGGRLFATCAALYCLEVYYRHLPLYGLPKKSRPINPP